MEHLSNFIFALIAIISLIGSIITMAYVVHKDKMKDINKQFKDSISNNIVKNYKKALQKELDKPHYKN